MLFNFDVLAIGLSRWRLLWRAILFFDFLLNFTRWKNFFSLLLELRKRSFPRLITIAEICNHWTHRIASPIPIIVFIQQSPTTITWARSRLVFLSFFSHCLFNALFFNSTTFNSSSALLASFKTVSLVFALVFIDSSAYNSPWSLFLSSGNIGRERRTHT